MATVTNRGQSDERDTTVRVVGRHGPAEYLSVDGRAHRHVDRRSRSVVDKLEMQFGPPAGHHDVRVDEFLVRGPRPALAARTRRPVQLDHFVVVGAHLKRVVRGPRRRIAGVTEQQRDAVVDARRPTLESHPQARRVSPLGQHVQPVHRAPAAQQERFGIAARTVGHVAQVVTAAGHVTPRARRLLRRVTTVIVLRIRRSVRKNQCLPAVALCRRTLYNDRLSTENRFGTFFF